MTDPTHPRAVGADLAIAPARTGDVDEIIALQRAAYRIEAERYDDFGLPPLTETSADLVAALDTHTVLVARHIGSAAGAIVGTARARVSGGTAHVARLSVRADLHGHGIGRQLLMAIEQAMAPVRRYELFTGHRSDRNLRMYERAGYRRVRSALHSDAVELIYLEKLVDLADRA